MDCALTPSDAHVLSGSEDGGRCTFSAHTPAAAPLGPVSAAPAGALTHTAHAGRVCYWDLVEEALVHSLPAHAGVVCSLAVHPEGALLVTSSTDGTVKVWR